MPSPSERRVVAALRASVLVVLEAAVPTYACCGWGGPSDGRGGIEGRERTRGDLTVVFRLRGPLVRRAKDAREEYGAVRGRGEDR